jgi:hypothetical protein
VMFISIPMSNRTFICSAKIIAILNLCLHLVVSAQERPEIQPGDFLGGPALTISGNVFDLNNKWTVPTSNRTIDKMGAWISPNAAGMTLVSAILSNINSFALDKKYLTDLKSFIEKANGSLPKNTGQLVEFTFNYSESGTTNINSIRFSAAGIGTSPQYAMADAPIIAISSTYDGSTAFPLTYQHYIWVYKDKLGNIEISTIKEPFIPAFKREATNIKIERQREERGPIVPEDMETLNFEIAQKYQLHADKLSETLRERDRLQEITKMDNDLFENQKAYNILYTKYQQAKYEQIKNANLFTFLDACQTLTSSLNTKSLDASPYMAGYARVKSELLDEYLNDTQRKLIEMKYEFNRKLDNIRSFYKKQRLPIPPVSYLPILN